MNKHNKNNIAIILHYYYTDQLDDLKRRFDLLRSDGINFDVIVTTPEVPVKNYDESKLIDMLNVKTVLKFENKGRDILPFIKCIPILQDYKYVCKIHTKRDIIGGPYNIEGGPGGAWRNLMYNMLLSPDMAKNAISKLDNNQRIYAPEEIWGGHYDRVNNNIKNMETLSTFLNYKIETGLFIAGSMFWVDPSYLNWLSEYNLESLFEPEMGAEDGKMEHALERALCQLVNNNIYNSVNKYRTSQNKYSFSDEILYLENFKSKNCNPSADQVNKNGWHLRKGSKKCDFSFITMVRDLDSYKELIESIKDQLGDHVIEIISIPNFFNLFTSAYKAYNHASEISSGTYNIFCHDDIVIENDFLNKIKNHINTLYEKEADWGVLGPAGVIDNIAYLYLLDENNNKVPEYPTNDINEVETLDELCLITKNDKSLKFDEQLTGFHFYGANLCYNSKLKGLRNFAINATCYHKSHKTGGSKNTSSVEGYAAYENCLENFDSWAIKNGITKWRTTTAQRDENGITIWLKFWLK